MPSAPSWWLTDDPTAGDALAPVTACLEAADIEIGPHTATPHWAGERLDLVWAIDVLWQPPTNASG